MEHVEVIAIHVCLCIPQGGHCLNVLKISVLNERFVGVRRKVAKIRRTNSLCANASHERQSRTVREQNSNKKMQIKLAFVTSTNGLFVNECSRT